MFGKGRAEAITDSDISRLANELACHPADLEAIAEVESNGFGWFKDGRIKILFEKHWFYKSVSGAKRDQAFAAALARKEWISPKNGGYKDQSNADARYRLLAKAVAIDEEAAFRSVSIGKFQIMGFNHQICGYATAKAMWAAFVDSEVAQLRAFAQFLKRKGLVPAIRSRDFDQIEEIYNGGGLNGAYAKKMREASDKLRAGKWKGWQPAPERSAAPPPEPAKPAPEYIPVPEPRKTETPPVRSPETKQPSRMSGLIAAALLAIAAAWAWLTSLPCNVLGFWC
ncbi:N-acetylmuramidase family protein [Arvimicrobium flavum]|uniref:N-acetylmuramidase family protein n=1 Tax=Arvimicrobium flavum TaxID=3393320 RepID=UPI00237A3B74|nr:N-acetylmuramidase family protein [Mesorhizobium shangrilense]